MTAIAERMPQTVAMRHVAWVGIAWARWRCIRRSAADRCAHAGRLGRARPCRGHARDGRDHPRRAPWLGGIAVAAGIAGAGVGYLATRAGLTNLEVVVVWSALFASMLRWATPLAFARSAGSSPSARAW